MLVNNLNDLNKYKFNISLKDCLLYLIIISIFLTGITFSRHITTTSGGDEGRVASIGNIELIETGDFVEEDTMIIIPGNPLSYKPIVQFDGSEMATCIFVEMVTSNEWEQVEDNKYAINKNNIDLMSFEISDEWTYLEKEKNNTYIFYKVLDPNISLDENIIKDSKIDVSKYIKEDDIETMNNISIKFKTAASQINEDISPEDAWDLIN